MEIPITLREVENPDQNLVGYYLPGILFFTTDKKKSK